MNSDNFNDFVNELKQKCNIVDIISKYVTLNRKGSSYWACCPFHNEKTPSFCVNDAKSNYVCYGCSASGDVFTFVMGMEHCTFMDAVRILADKVGMRVPEFSNNGDTSNTKKKERLYSIMRDTALFYHDCLKGDKAQSALNYIAKRKLSLLTIRNFGMGLSPGFEQLPHYLLGKGYTQEELIDSGACDIKNGKLYDAEANRLIVPIINNLGKVIAFGGRLLEEADFAKYKNTKETVIFEKKKELFGFTNLKKAKLDSSLKDGIIIVEGYMDVISMCQVGILNVCASMGTALTPQQAKTLKFFSNKVYLCYDGDGAGQKATYRGLDILREQDLDIRVMTLPKGLDPDDMIRQYGKDEFLKLKEQAVSPIEYKLTAIYAQYDMSDPSQQGKFAFEAITLLNELKSSVEREAYLPLIKRMSGLTMDSIRVDFIKQNMSGESIGEPDNKELKPRVSAEVKRYYTAARYALWCIYNENLAFTLPKIELISFFEDEKHKEIYNFARAKLSEGQPLKLEYLATFRDNAEAAEISNSNYSEITIDKEKMLDDCIKSLQNSYYRMLKDRLAQDIATESNAETRQNMKNLIGELIVKINNLR